MLLHRLSNVLVAACVMAVIPFACLAAEPIKLQDIDSLLRAKLPDSVILSKAKQSTPPLELSVNDILTLKKAGASDALIQALLDLGSARASGQPVVSAPPSAAAPAQTAPSQPGVGVAVVGGAVLVSAGSSAVAMPQPSGATTMGNPALPADPDDPMAPHDSGIYILAPDRTGKNRMTMLERAAYQGAKTGGVFGAAMTGGLMKAKMIAVIPGPSAAIRISAPHPTFYFYFEDKSAGLGKTNFGMNALSNPNQFALLRLQTKGSVRQTVIGKVGAFGMSSGSDEKSMIAFKSERIRSGLYKVTLATPLEPGEYAFMASSAPAAGPMASGSAASMDIFDFGTAGEY